MIYQMTQADIDAGEQCSAYWCPVAICIKRISGKDDIRVRGGIYIDGKHFDSTDEIVAFTSAFDTLGPKRVSPIVFEL